MLMYLIPDPVLEVECIPKLVIIVSDCIPGFRSVCPMCIPTFKCVYHMCMLQGACYHSMYPVGDGQDFSLFFHGLHVSHVYPRVLEWVSCVYPKNKKCVSRAGVDTLYLQV